MLEINSVSKSYKSKLVVNNINFKVSEPGVFGLLGTNGAGKTTTIRMILGIITKDSGNILWDNKEFKRGDIKCGYLPEERGIYPKIKVIDQLMYFASLKGLKSSDAKKACLYWLERLELSNHINSLAEYLSKGNQQKLQLIASILHEPVLLILDEPFSGLDPINANLFRDIFNELIQKGTYIIMSSHQMSTVEEHCKEILILKNGDTVLQGNLADIKKGYGRSNLVITTNVDILKFSEEKNLKCINQTANSFHFKIQNENDGLSLLKTLIDNNIEFYKYEICEPTLHEIFVQKVG